jgi:ATP-dependent Clp endopeptidase proteolytic subunit ClpP
LKISKTGRAKFSNSEEEEFEKVIRNLTQSEYAMNFIADVSNHIKAVELKVDPIIIRVNKFDEDSAKEFVDAMSRAQNTGQSVIPIVIDSYGGQVYALMTMIGAIKGSRIPVATIVEGKAMSCGALLYSFGAEGMRYMDPDATLMIHDVASGAWGKVEEIKADAKEVDRLNKKVYEMMARNCGKPSDYFLKLVHERGHADWYLDGQEAKTHNLANELRVPTLTCKIDLKYTLD